MKTTTNPTARKRSPTQYVDASRIQDFGCLVYTLPIKLVSEANVREHYFAKARRSHDQRRTIEIALASCRPMARDGASYRVIMTRHGVRQLDDDNLARSCKSVRDEIARWLKVDDGDMSRVRWEYAQHTDGRYGVTIRIVETNLRWVP